MRLSYVILLIVALVLVAGCIQDEPIKELRIPGHAEIYTFETDIREAVKVYSNDPVLIRQKFFSADNVTLLFDGSSGEDNAYFVVTLVNLGKIKTYFANEGRFIQFTSYYLDRGQWFDSQNKPLASAPNGTLMLWLKGPHTGANETSVTIENNTITLQGASLNDLRLAGDRLTLIVFGINETAIKK
ncbi:MAG: hypothetical protein HY832_02930 [Candidatus Aenigmarchaeota archaeon]|nr:hypothetical protein [Candidatus Aenigmarchaeota archaeon]